MSAPELYEDEIRRYCLYRQVELSEVFSDIDFSGYRGAKPRPRLEELKGRKHEFSLIVVPKLSRFGRSVKDLVELFDHFDRSGVPLVFLDMNIDSSTSQGRLLRHVMAAFAEYESDVKADYARTNYALLSRAGRAWGGRPPFGYDRVDKTYVINPAKAKITREIFARYAAGESTNQIAKDLNRQGKKRPSGTNWMMQQVGRVLDNPAFAGLCLLEGEFYPATWEAIIDNELWERVRTRRQHRSATHRRNRLRGRGPYLLTGLIYCGHCNNRIHHRSKKNTKSGIYRCTGWDIDGGCNGVSIVAHRAEEMVTSAFLARARFSLPKDEGPIASQLPEPRAAWDRASLEERRRLLALAIRRVVVVSWRTIGRRVPNEIRIEWMDGRADQLSPLYLLAPDPPTKPPRNGVSESRSDSLRLTEALRERDKAAARTRRVVGYHEEWRQFRAHNHKDA